MTLNTIAAFCLGALIAAASAVAAGQQTTATPGQMTEAHVRIDNRGQSEAVPVDLRDVNVHEPLRVQVINGDIGHPTVQPVPVRIATPVWEYAVVTIPADQDLARALTTRGAAGWETAGIALPASSGTTLVLKRMR
jgi:hypothetical protein